MTIARSLFWIEGDEMASLLERVTGAPPARGSEGTSPTSRSPSSAPPPPSSIVDQGEELAVRGNLQQRLEAFLDWLPSVVPHTGAFVADQQGLALAERKASPAVIAAAAAMADQWHGIQNDFALAGDGGLAIELGEEGQLFVVPARATWGSICVGLVSSTRLDRAGRVRIAEALERAVAEKEGEGS